MIKLVIGWTALTLVLVLIVAGAVVNLIYWFERRAARRRDSEYFRKRFWP